MSLPFRPEKDAVPPSSVAGQPNGRIPANLLESCGIGKLVMAGPAARAMRALVKAAARDGVRLSSSGTYRTYERQVVAFDGTSESVWTSGINGRYVPDDLWRKYESVGRKWYVSSKGEHDVRSWNGKRWKRRAGTAGSAVPGTSNHGKGVAIDFAELNANGDVVSLTKKGLDWLAKNGTRFGYWNTVQSESWHWCWCLGDQVPASVLAEEMPAPPPPPPSPTPPPPAERTHTVVNGDTYWSLAVRYLGKGSRHPEISALNGNRPLRAGMVLRIPAV